MIKHFLLFGGASEEHQLIRALLELPLKLTVSVASDYGLAMLPPPSHRLCLRAGIMEAGEMAELLQKGGFSGIIDATHPYAVAASANIQAAAAQTGLPCLRLLRQQSDLAGCVSVASIPLAVAELNKGEGPVLLTTGSKDLRQFAAVKDAAKRLYARVLPTAESLAACAELGLPLSRIIAMQGPFSQRLNSALLREFEIKTLVTKDGGAAGGFPEKVAAGRELGIEIIVIRRPPETGLDQEELLRRMREIVEER